MWYRTLTIGSAGKALFLTGWKIGWIYGRPELIYNAQIVHQNTVYTGCTPLQVPLPYSFKTLSKSYTS